MKIPDPADHPIISGLVFGIIGSWIIITLLQWLEAQYCSGADLREHICSNPTLVSIVKRQIEFISNLRVW